MLQINNHFKSQICPTHSRNWHWIHQQGSTLDHLVGSSRRITDSFDNCANMLEVWSIFWKWCRWRCQCGLSYGMFVIIVNYFEFWRTISVWETLAFEIHEKAYTNGENKCMCASTSISMRVLRSEQGHSHMHTRVSQMFMFLRSNSYLEIHLI